LYFIPGTQFGGISVTGLTGLGTESNTPTLIALNSLQLTNSLTWSSGRHTVKSGVSWTRWFNNQNSSFVLGGSFSFTSIGNFVRNVPGTFEGRTPGSTTDRYWRQNLIGLFIQDDFAWTSRLTVNMGLRYEFFTSPKEKYDRVASFRDLSAAATTVGYPLFENPSLKNFAPRIGFAWDVFGDGRTALRGGAGAFYEPILGNFYRAYGNRTPPFFELANASFPNVLFPNALDNRLQPVQQRLDLLQFQMENPYRLQYNLSVEREVLPQTVVTFGYIGSRGFHQIRNIEANHAIPTIQPDGRYFFPTVRVRRNPNFGSIRLRLPDGNSWYNGLIAGVRKRFGAGLQVQASYTWGKSIDEGSQAIGSGDFDNSFQPRYGYDRSDNRGLSDFDIRHNFVVNYSYDVPFGRHLRGVAGALASGWQLAGVIAARSGVPFTPVLGFDRARAFPRSGGAG
ncbi:MAG: TonB-dependent receptor domain-containing protein, partial [Acidimicrobiia bacterium]